MARQGIPLLLLAALACWLTYRFAGLYWAAVPAAALVVLLFVFRNRQREIPAVPLGVVSPVDGRVVSIDETDGVVSEGRATRIVLRIDILGARSAFSPVEGKVINPSAEASDGDAGEPNGHPDDRQPDVKSKDLKSNGRANGLWLRTDEGQDVVLRFSGYRFGIAPKSIVRYGERLGQGVRCARVRLTRNAELYLPIGSKVLVETGQPVRAGSEVIAELPHD